MTRDWLLKSEGSSPPQVVGFFGGRTAAGAVLLASAALIIADKTDVRRSRVREKDPMLFDVHDRVNYAVTATMIRNAPAIRRLLLRIRLYGNAGTRRYFDFDYGR